MCCFVWFIDDVMKYVCLVILKYLMLLYFLCCLVDYIENCILVYGMKSIFILEIKIEIVICIFCKFN